MIAILFAGLAHGTEHPPTNPIHAPPAHDAAANKAAHAESGHAEAEHGGHVTYSDDDDLDGVPNWRDASAGGEANTESYVLPSLGWHAVNLALLLGVLWYATRGPLADVFRNRALAIRNELTGTARAREEAHQRHQDLVARLHRIETEVQAMEQRAAVEAQQEEEKLVERANREAERIAAQTERNLRDETNRARQALRAEAVDLAVQLAEATLSRQVNATDRQDLAREFLRSLKEGDRV